MFIFTTFVKNEAYQNVLPDTADISVPNSKFNRVRFESLSFTIDGSFHFLKSKYTNLLAIF